MQTDDVLKDQRVLKKSKNKIQFRFISIVLIKSSNFDLFLGKMKLVFEIFLLIVCMFQFISRKKLLLLFGHAKKKRLSKYMSSNFTEFVLFTKYFFCLISIEEKIT